VRPSGQPGAIQLLEPWTEQAPHRNAQTFSIASTVRRSIRSKRASNWSSSDPFDASLTRNPRALNALHLEAGDTPNAMQHHLGITASQRSGGWRRQAPCRAACGQGSQSSPKSRHVRHHSPVLVAVAEPRGWGCASVACALVISSLRMGIAHVEADEDADSLKKLRL
jgi:hypothetical protein